MTTDAKIGERLMLGLRGSEPGDPGLETDLAACASVGVRAVLLFDRDVASGRARNVIGRDQLRGLTAHIRSRLGADTIIAVDQEGGRVQRLGPDHGFAAHPSAAEFAGMPPRDRVAAADRLAAELADVGINLNLSPCVDIGDGSPVIGGLGRSFGGDPDAVVECASAVIVAHRGRGIGCALKHFPGHGSAPGDSHKTLPDITRSFDPGRDLAPYRAL
ncbi:MAG: glycoside hydrolase family 3 N-terminal domain-containing protein, partial [Planctomycetota bacterium]